MPPTSAGRGAARAAAAAALLFAFGGCGDGDRATTPDEFRSDLEDRGFTRSEADCVTERTFARLDQTQIDDLFQSEELEDVGAGIIDSYDAIVDDCDDLIAAGGNPP